MKPAITIEYCPKCGWLLRPAYMAQELLTTFTDDVKSVVLQPAEVSGRFSIYINEEKIFDRKEQTVEEAVGIIVKYATAGNDAPTGKFLWKEGEFAW